MMDSQSKGLSVAENEHNNPEVEHFRNFQIYC